MQTVSTENTFYHADESAPRGGSTCVLKHGDLFGIFDRFGDIEEGGLGEQGLYFNGTRYLSHLRLRIAGHDPMLLNSSVAEDNSRMVADLTTRDFRDEAGNVTSKGTLHLFRSKRLWKGALYEHLRIANYGDNRVGLPVEIDFATDGADIFEVRGVERRQRGRVAEPAGDSGELIVLEYHGLDGRVRRTEIRFSETPSSFEVAKARATFIFDLPASEERELYFTAGCLMEGDPGGFADHRAVQLRAGEAWKRHRGETAAIEATSERFNDLVSRAQADLYMLNTEIEGGVYPYAGVPWFSTPFGRDGIITALQNLWRDASLARGVLEFLSKHQAVEDDPERDAEPGKILHELREGEMAALGEIPYAGYYGSVDSTPLYLMLAGAYFRKTGDRELIQSLWPSIEAALDWIENHGDRDGDGFVEYERRARIGILQQGWKDSDDSMFHRDGSPALGPVALCEVQGYVYAAKTEIAELADCLKKHDLARKLRAEASVLRERFHEAFWCEDIGTYAMALDGDKRPCRVRSSNAGHALYTGIADPMYAGRLVETLVAPDSCTGWGVRTLSSLEARFNPMSYHNGSIWPHDNGIVAMGMARYGFKQAMLKVMSGIVDAGLALDLKRLPELFCGFERVAGQTPTLYPVACSPQAWASGSVFHLIEAALGMEFSATKPQLTFHRPVLPKNINKIEIHNLTLPGGCVDLALRRHPRDVGFNIMKKSGDVEVVVVV